MIKAAVKACVGNTFPEFARGGQQAGASGESGPSRQYSAATGRRSPSLRDREAGGGSDPSLRVKQ